jgi:hypothetical protein
MSKQLREPLLADRFLAADYKNFGAGLVTREFWDTTRDNLCLAKRFVLTEDAARYCAQLLKDAPRIVADAQDFAIPSHERMYIEFPFKVWYETLTGAKLDYSGDSRIGYLIVGNEIRSEVRVLAESLGEAGLSPFEYHLNQPLTFQQQLALAKRFNVSRMAFDLFFWGSSVAGIGTVTVKNGQKHVTFDEWQKEGIRALRDNHSFSIHIPHRREHELPAIWDKFYDASAGDLRNIIGLLLFLNRTAHTRVEREEPYQSRMINRKPVNLLKHRVITMHVNPVPKLIHLAAGEGIRRRLHDVKGHFCHNEITWTNNHDHEWDEDPEHDFHWYCVCGAFRWWRKKHKRGDDAQGIVTSSYKVKK